MKKNLQNAMTNHFQNMVGTPSQQEEVQPQQTNSKPVKKESARVTQVAPVMNEPVVETIPEPVPVTVNQPVSPVQATPVAPVSQPVEQPIPAPVIEQPQVQVIPQQQAPTGVISAPVAQPVTSEPEEYEEQYEEPVKTRRHNKKTIPLMPDEKSSGVLHIRLGELRSYVDFMTQSGKISYQQYISNLIEQDYEKNKDLYLKYKSFMDQLNF